MFNPKEDVVCVDDSNVLQHAPQIRKGEIYRLEAVIACACGFTAVYIEGKIGITDAYECNCGQKYPSYGFQPYRGDRFRPLDEAIKYFEEALDEELNEIFETVCV